MKSLTELAQNWNVARTTLSSQIKRLEGELGYSLGSQESKGSPRFFDAAEEDLIADKLGYKPQQQETRITFYEPEQKYLSFPSLDDFEADLSSILPVDNTPKIEDPIALATRLIQVSKAVSAKMKEDAEQLHLETLQLKQANQMLDDQIAQLNREKVRIELDKNATLQVKVSETQAFTEKFNSVQNLKKSVDVSQSS